jgi:hypothetical protein
MFLSYSNILDILPIEEFTNIRKKIGALTERYFVMRFH